MRSTPVSSPPKPTADTIRRYVGALPAVSEPLVLDERAAQAARSVLERSDPALEQRFSVQIKAITKEVAAQLDRDPVSGRYAVTERELRGIIARAVSRTGGQFAVAIGQALADIPLVTGFAADDEPPERYKQQPGLQQGF